MIFGRKQNPDLEKFAELMVRGVTDLFQERGNIAFSSRPVLEKQEIIEYEGRMRVDGMDKFDNEPTYVSAINYYINSKAMEKHDAVGAVVVYVKQEYLAGIMKKLQYPPFDDDSDDELRDSCGTLCNIIAGRVKSEFVKAGYIELEMSHFINFRNSAFDGVEFCSSEYDKYEAMFELDGKKKLVVELSLGIIPKG